MKIKKLHKDRHTKLSYEEFFDEISHAWEKKAKELQARRWKVVNKIANGGLH